MKFNINISPKIFLIIIVLTLIAFSVMFQYASPVLYGVDSYYHIKLASLIKIHGFFRQFWWTKFSTFTNCFGDKDLTLHLISIPFTFLDNFHHAAKWSTIFINILLLSAFIFVLRKYLPISLTAIFVFLPFLTPYFVFYYVKLRPATLVTIINILGVTFLIEKKWKIVALLSFIYPLSHISFPLMIFFAILCEIIRYLHHKEFFIRNISAVLLATSLGCIFHPHYPNNLLVFYFNAILVPILIFLHKKVYFGVELFPVNTKIILSMNFSTIMLFVITIWHKMICKLKLSFSTIFLFAITNVYILMSCISVRFLYPTNIFVIIFIASYLKDVLREGGFKISPKVFRVFVVLFVCFTIICGNITLVNFLDYALREATRNMHYELVGRWMKDNIPPDVTIYHAYFSDSPYFLCMNPKNRYLSILDPIFMIYYNPYRYRVYRRLRDGEYNNAYQIIKEVFSTSYGYAHKSSLLYKINIINNPHFDILYEDDMGVVFKIIEETTPKEKEIKRDNEKPDK